MQIVNFEPRAHKHVAALIVLRLGQPIDGSRTSALVGALVEAGIVPEPAEIEGIEHPVEVLAVSWRPPKRAESDRHRVALEEVGAQFEVETAWCVQSTAWVRKKPKAEETVAATEAPKKAKTKWKSIIPVWSPEQGPLPFPVDGYPDILDEELDWYDYGIAVKLSGPGLAGEEQVLDTFSQLWCQSFKKFRHIGMEYDRARRSAVIWIDRWTFPGSDRKAVHHTLWLASRIHEILPVRHASFQGADMAWKYRGLTGDDTEPFILGGNPLLSVYRERGEEGVAAWSEEPPGEWSQAEEAAMLVALVEEHPPGDAATTPTALRLAERAITLDPDQDQARADILTLLIHNGQMDAALRRIEEWQRPRLTTFGVKLIEEKAPDRLADAIGRIPARAANLAVLESFGLTPQTLPLAVWIDLAARRVDPADGTPLLARLVLELPAETRTAVVVAVARSAADRLTEFLRQVPDDAGAVEYLYPAAYEVLRTPNSSNPRDATPESLAICERIMALPVPPDPSSWYTWAHASAIIFAYHLGDLDRATELVDRSLHLAEANPAIYFNAACVYAGGRRDVGRGLDLLRRAVQAGFRDVEAIRTDDDLVLLHDDPEFRAILAMAQPDEVAPTAQED